jgi:hypothetical protein
MGALTFSRLVGGPAKRQNRLLVRATEDEDQDGDLMPSQLYQVRNLYRDQRFDGFLLRAGKKARVRIEVDKADGGRYRGTAHLIEAGGRVVAEADAPNPVETFEAVVKKLYNTHFNFVARIEEEASPPGAKQAKPL